MKYRIEIRNDKGLVKVKGPYDSRTRAQVAIARDKARGWLPEGFTAEVTE